MTEIDKAHDNSSDQRVDEQEWKRQLYTLVRKTNDWLDQQRRYVEVHECVLGALFESRYFGAS